MLVVADESELNWWLRRFAPRILLRLSPDFVEAVSRQGTAQSAPVLSLIRKGDRVLVAGAVVIRSDAGLSPASERQSASQRST